MKKFLVASLLLVGLTAFGSVTDSYTQMTSDLEATFQALQEEEAALIESKKAEAAQATESLGTQKALLAQITKREEQINKYKDYKFFKEEYKLLAKRYGALKKDVEAEMKAQQKLIDEINTIIKPTAAK